MKSIKYILYCLVLFTGVELNAQLKELVRMPLNPENFVKWDAYIKKYAPSDSAFVLVESLANIHYYSGNAIVAIEAYSMYEPIFPRYFQAIEQKINLLINIALQQPYFPEKKAVWEKYMRERANNKQIIVILNKMTENYVKNKQWDSAATVFKYYKSMLSPAVSKDIDKIIAILEAPELGLKVNNLGVGINSRFSEWDPNPTPDGKYLYFSGEGRPGGFGGVDVWASEFKNGKWNQAFNLGSTVNGNRNETIDNVSSDGNSVFLSGNFEGSYGNFDIYTIERTANGWSGLMHLPYPINTKYTDESANYTPDGKAIIFNSDRPGAVGEFVPFGTPLNGNTQGNVDMYITFKTDSGWSPAINLGPKINTPYAERSAYLHPDGKTLYFSSDGYPGLGGLDVFKSVRLNDTSWTEWSEPVNLGKEINSSGNDWGYKPCLSGDSAFFAAENRQDGYGQWDIFSVSLPKFAKPNKVAVIKGKISDKNGNPIGAALKWENLLTGEIVGELKSSPQTGEYFIVLPLGKKYGYFAENQGYYPTSNFVNLTKVSKDTTIEKNITLIEIKDLMKSNAEITINNVFFDFDKYELKEESRCELDRLVKLIKEYSPAKVYITGYTDNQGGEEHNQILSENRAKAVTKYIISKGISSASINATGKGSAQPVADNSSEFGRSLNRRVVVSFGK